MIRIPHREYQDLSKLDESSLSPVTIPCKRNAHQKLSPASNYYKNNRSNGKPLKRQKITKNESAKDISIESKENQRYNKCKSDFNTHALKSEHKKNETDSTLKRNIFPDSLIKEFSFLDSPSSSAMNPNKI